MIDNSFTVAQLRAIGKHLKIPLKGRLKKDKIKEIKDAHVSHEMLQEAIELATKSSIKRKKIKKTKSKITQEQSSYTTENSRILDFSSGLNDMILYQALKQLSNPSYSNILSFCTSFGLKTEIIIQSLIKRLKEGDVAYINLKDPILIILYKKLFKSTIIEYPIAIKVIDVLTKLPELKLKTPVDVVDFFKDLERKYSGIAILSSSQLGEPEDLITFKRIFPETISFTVQNRWAL
jgi:hypothetical protein